MSTDQFHDVTRKGSCIKIAIVGLLVMTGGVSATPEQVDRFTQKCATNGVYQMRGQGAQPSNPFSDMWGFVCDAASAVGNFFTGWELGYESFERMPSVRERWERGEIAFENSTGTSNPGAVAWFMDKIGTAAEGLGRMFATAGGAVSDPAGCADGPNRYAYVGADLIDPDGRLAKEVGQFTWEVGGNILENSAAHVGGAGLALYNAGVDIRDTYQKEGLSALLNPFTGDFAPYELLSGGYGAVGSVAGIPISFVSGDIYHDYGAVSEGVRNIAVSGMDFRGLYTRGYADTMAADILNKTGQSTAALDNPSWGFGVGSFLHTVFGELGVKLTPSLYVADAVRGGVQNIYPHSQGTLVVAGMSGLITDSQRSQLNMQTFGGEIQWSKSTWGFNNVENIVNPKDMVPRSSPLNLVGDEWKGIYIPFVHGLKQHSWPTYIDQMQKFQEEP